MTPPRSLSVLTINIWNRQHPWERRVKLLRAQIADLMPDVIGMQEVMSDGAHTLAHEATEGLDYRVVFGAAKPLAGGIAFGNAILSRYEHVATEVFPLPSADTDEARSLLLAELDTPYGRLPFLTTHLAWKFHHGYVREQQVMEIARIMKTRLPIVDHVPPAILVGDFNARPDATEVRFLSGLHSIDKTSTFLADCFDEVGEGPGYTYDSRHNPHAAFTHEAPRRIDYVFVRGPDARGRGKPLSAKVVLDRVEDGVAASDHWGVLADIRM